MPLVGIGTLLTPFSPASVPLPPETGGRGHTSLRVGGWGESQFRRGAYTVVLFICTYFVVSAIEYSCAHGAQINFGDLIPYLTYGGGVWGRGQETRTEQIFCHCKKSYALKPRVSVLKTIAHGDPAEGVQDGEVQQILHVQRLAG
jgi:hypothetical protein